MILLHLVDTLQNSGYKPVRIVAVKIAAVHSALKGRSFAQFEKLLLEA
jgi:hypothetical protein